MSAAVVRVVHVVRAFLHQAIVVRTLWTLAWVFAAFAVFFGVGLLVAPKGMTHLPTLRYTFENISPDLWGAAFAALGVWLVAGLIGHARASQALGALAAVVSIWSLFILPAIIQANGAITAVIVYPFVALIILIIGLALSEQEVRRG